MRARSLVAAAATAILALGAAPTASAEEPSPPAFTVSSPTAQVGTNVTLSRDNICPQAEANETATVTVLRDGQTVTTEQAAAGSMWMGTIKVPDTPGTYTYTLNCQTAKGTTAYAPQTITVLPAPPENLTASIGTITRNGCTVSIPVTTTGAYTFEMEVWDDQRRLQDTVWETKGDGTTVLHWTITGRADDTFPEDIYFNIRVNGSENINKAEQRANATFSYPDEVADACSAQVPVSASVRSDTPSPAAGQRITVEGTGLVTLEPTDITLEDGTRIGGSADGTPHMYSTATDGTFSYDVTLPATLPPGDHTLTIKGRSSQRSAQVPITVRGAQP
ncbi:hypothetical protein [Actinomyces bowdenii]|uniref:Bacterial Ig domain-containing protein n=1 Tax=Actinomyces bowdenii TaxID=131109 RepID=A0A853EQ06_9ACTO|nr:hypothetical protein [Actinomyces bowdenii]MBF0697633.1 hypothetical protein [Actinomyces bowdenii]NYS69806.1 hypothetical protein [Actinomyces bowdenii]